MTQVDRFWGGVKTPVNIAWKFAPRPEGRGYSPDLPAPPSGARRAGRGNKKSR